MSTLSSSESFADLDKEQSGVSTETSNSSGVFTTPLPVDILICGSCSSHFSDLKLFIDHKQSCINTSLTNSASNNESTSHDSSQSTPNNIAIPQQIVGASAGSILGLPVGTPHVILQTSSGMAQMYRIVLEPSLHGPQISPGAHLTAPSAAPVLNHSQYEESGGNSAAFKPDSFENQKLHNMEPVESSWSTSGMSNSDLHTEEEDVATFLATQLVASQSAPHHLKRKLELPKLPCGETRDHELNLAEGNADTVCLQDHGNRAVQSQNDAKKYLHVEPQIKIHQFEPQIKIQQLDPNVEPNAAGGLAEKLNQELKQYRRQKLACSYENCSYQTFYQKDMARHVRIHTGEKPFECTICGSKFSRQDKLKVHIRIHKNERPYACKVPGCYYSAIEKAHLNKHTRTHTNERPYKCQLCPYAARDGSQLTVHLRSHTGDTPFHCQTDGCPATFKTSSDLRRHERLHTGEKPFKCSECDYASALKSNLKVHFRINHYKTVRFGCRICPFSGTTKKQLKEHEKTHPDLLPLGDKEGEFLFGQVPSTAPKRPLGYTRTKVRSKPSCIKNFRCEHCGCGFVRGDSYRSHIRQHQRHNVAAAVHRNLTQINMLKNRTDNFETVNLQGQDVTDITQNEKIAMENCLAGTSTTEPFSSYVITIDGVSSVYSAADIRPQPILSEVVGAAVQVDVSSEAQLKSESTSDLKGLT